MTIIQYLRANIIKRSSIIPEDNKIIIDRNLLCNSKNYCINIIKCMEAYSTS